MLSQPSSDGVFATSRLFSHTPAQIVAAFADAERLASWWGPAGFRNTFKVFEFRPEGRWSLVMHGPDGTDYPNESTFIETGPQRVIIRHVSAPLFTLTVTLSSEQGKTLLEWQQAFDDPSLAEKLAPVIIPANEQNLDRLQAELDRAGG